MHSIQSVSCRQVVSYQTCATLHWVTDLVVCSNKLFFSIVQLQCSPLFARSHLNRICHSQHSIVAEIPTLASKLVRACSRNRATSCSFSLSRSPTLMLLGDMKLSPHHGHHISEGATPTLSSQGFCSSARNQLWNRDRHMMLEPVEGHPAAHSKADAVRKLAYLFSLNSKP